MKFGKMLAPVFAVLGLVLMIGTVGLCLSSLDAQPKGDIPQEAMTCAEKTLLAISEGDFATAAAQMYGQPDLGLGETMTQEAFAVWEIFRKGITCTVSNVSSDYYVSGSGFAVDTVLTVPKIASITDTLKDHTRELMNGRIAAAEEMADIYDDDHEFRQELVDEVLAEAMTLALSEEPETTTITTTLNLVYRDGQWWAVPEESLIKALSGGLA